MIFGHSKIILGENRQIGELTWPQRPLAILLA